MLKCPWYNNQIKLLSGKIWTPTNARYSKTSAINNLVYSKNVNNIFSFKHLVNPNPVGYTCVNSLSNYMQKKNIISDQINSNKQSLKNNKTARQKNIINNNIRKLEKKAEEIKIVERTDKVKLKLDKKQKKVLLSWAKECNKVYNYTIRLYNKQKDGFNLDFKVTREIVFDNLYGNEEKPAPYNMLEDEVHRACINIQACKTKFQNGQIRSFVMKEKSFYEMKFKSILIHTIGVKGIHSNSLGENKIPYEKEINHECKLKLYFSRKKVTKAILHIPTDCIIKEENEPEKEKVAAIDPGSVIFGAYYSLNSCGFIGENINKLIYEYYHKIANLQSILDKNVNKEGKSIKHKRHLREKINFYYTKMGNVIDNMHKQAALFLCKNFKTILLPKFDTKKMIKKATKEEENNKRKKGLTAKVKFTLSMLSHAKFRRCMFQKGEEYGNNIKVVSEEYTTQCCHECGYLSKQYKGREKKCEYCSKVSHRDLTGSRGILLLNNGLVKIRIQKKV